MLSFCFQLFHAIAELQHIKIRNVRSYKSVAMRKNSLKRYSKLKMFQLQRVDGMSNNKLQQIGSQFDLKFMFKNNACCISPQIFRFKLMVQLETSIQKQGEQSNQGEVFPTYIIFTPVSQLSAWSRGESQFPE